MLTFVRCLSNVVIYAYNAHTREKQLITQHGNNFAINLYSDQKRDILLCGAIVPIIYITAIFLLKYKYASIANW